MLVLAIEAARPLHVLDLVLPLLREEHGSADRVAVVGQIVERDELIVGGLDHCGAVDVFTGHWNSPSPYT